MTPVSNRKKWPHGSAASTCFACAAASPIAAQQRRARSSRSAVVIARPQRRTPGSISCRGSSRPRCRAFARAIPRPSPGRASRPLPDAAGRAAFVARGLPTEEARQGLRVQAVGRVRLALRQPIHPHVTGRNLHNEHPRAQGLAARSPPRWTGSAARRFGRPQCAVRRIRWRPARLPCSQDAVGFPMEPLHVGRRPRGGEVVNKL